MRIVDLGDDIVSVRLTRDDVEMLLDALDTVEYDAGLVQSILVTVLTKARDAMGRCE